MSGVTLAFDMGGTRVKAAAVSGDRVEGLRTESTGRTFAETLEVVATLGRALLADHPATSAAACLPGIIGEDGSILALPGKMPGAEGANLRELLQAEFGLPTTVCNDAIAFGTGEAVGGAGRGHHRVVVMTIGTGIGVTAFEAGVPMGTGPFGGGTLGGQIPIAAEGGSYTDTSGRTDTIEALCRADRLVDYARDAGASASTTSEVLDAVRAGDHAAVAGITLYRGLLARGMTALAHAHAPDIIVVGGGPAGPGSPILDGVEADVNRRLFGTYRTRIELAQGGDAAALIGLARLATRTGG